VVLIYQRKEEGSIDQMEEMFQINGTDLVVKVPRELDHHTAEKMNAGADRIVETEKISGVLFMISGKRNLWTAPAWERLWEDTVISA
jgi:hypothetical protein